MKKLPVIFISIFLVHPRSRRLHDPKVAIRGAEQRNLVRNFHSAGISENRVLESQGRRAGSDQREGVQGREVLPAQVRRLRPNADIRPRHRQAYRGERIRRSLLGKGLQGRHLSQVTFNVQVKKC